jgi:hypothetical protein
MAGAREIGGPKGAGFAQLKLVVRCLDAKVVPWGVLRKGPDTARATAAVVDSRLVERLGVSLGPDTARATAVVVDSRLVK